MTEGPVSHIRMFARELLLRNSPHDPCRSVPQIARQTVVLVLFPPVKRSRHPCRRTERLVERSSICNTKGIVHQHALGDNIHGVPRYPLIIATTHRMRDGRALLARARARARIDPSGGVTDGGTRRPRISPRSCAEVSSRRLKQRTENGEQSSL